MPTYDYECPSCHNHFSRRHNMSDSAVKKCPECGSGVKRLISGGKALLVRNPRISNPDNHQTGVSDCAYLVAGCNQPKRCYTKR